MKTSILTNRRFFRESVVLFLAWLACPLISFAATIEVTAQIGDPGCDLVEAIKAANSNAPIGGCSSGSSGSDLIVLNFNVPISEFVVSSVDNGDNGLPLIASEIRILGRGADKVVIKRSDAPSTLDFRLFLVIETGSLSLENISVQNGKLPNSDGSSFKSGGAILVQGGLLDVINSEFINNQSPIGGALRLSNNFDNVVTIRNSLFSNNRAIQSGFLGGSGGAISHGRGELTVIDSEFVGNRSSGSAGALSVQTNTTTAIYNTLFTDNSSVRNGGAISMGSTATISIYDSTVSNNTAGPTGHGGGISLNGGGSTEINASITNTTISDNLASSGGGIAIDRLNTLNNSMLSIINSIVSGNSSTDTFRSSHEIDARSENNILSFSHSLIGHAGITTAQAVAGEVIIQSPNILATSDGNTPTLLNNILLPLADNGGPTRTHALPSNSPAIDAATDGTPVQIFVFTFYVPGCRGVELLPAVPLPAFRSDQRGIQRPVGAACDIGSYEGELDDSQCFVVPTHNNKTVVFCL